MVREDQDKTLSISKKCQILGISRSTLYYQSKPWFSAEDLIIMKEMDEIYTKYPFFGHRRMRDELYDRNIKIGKDRVLKYQKYLGLEPIYPKKRTSIPNSKHTIFPYLLRELKISSPDQVWAADITYVRLGKGFCYLMVIIDWFSRYVLSWSLSNSLHRAFCIDALNEALENNKRPKIFKTDQGSQFTSEDFTGILKEQNIQISMDSKGAWIDNVIVERFFRSIKYENVYILSYENMEAAFAGISDYMKFYNKYRRHTSLKKRRPYEVYHQDLKGNSYGRLN